MDKLVNMVGNSQRRRVLVHMWVLGIEKNWMDYADINSKDGSDFIAVRTLFTQKYLYQLS